MERIMIIKDSCSLEEILEEKDFYYYDTILDQYSNKEAIAFFEKKYSEYIGKYFEIINIPANATDVTVIPFDEGTIALMVVDGKIKWIYPNI